MRLMDAEIIDLRLTITKAIGETSRNKGSKDTAAKAGVQPRDLSKLVSGEVEHFSTDRLLAIGLRLGYKFNLEVL